MPASGTAAAKIHGGVEDGDEWCGGDVEATEEREESARARDPVVVESKRRAIQRRWSRLLHLGARAAPVDAASVSKPQQGAFCKINDEETSRGDALYVPLADAS